MQVHNKFLLSHFAFLWMLLIVEFSFFHFLSQPTNISMACGFPWLETDYFLTVKSWKQYYKKDLHFWVFQVETK